MFVRRVHGNSMAPTIVPGSLIVARKKTYHKNDLVIAKVGGREVVKRVLTCAPKLTLKGDNPNSAYYDDVSEDAIVGVVIWPKKKQ